MELEDIEQGLRGDPKILVKFSIDENAVINIAAQDLKTSASSDVELSYNFDEENDSKDDPTELSIVALKLSIRGVLDLIPGEIPSRIMEAQKEAFEIGNQELLQSVLEELQDLSKK